MPFPMHKERERTKTRVEIVAESSSGGRAPQAFGGNAKPTTQMDARARQIPY